MTCLAIDLRRTQDKSRSLHRSNAGPLALEVELRRLRAIPGSPFAYWAGGSALDTFETLPALDTRPTVVVSTNPLNDDFRYARCQWEIGPETLFGRWIPWSKGGPFARYYADVEMVIAWSANRETYSGFIGTKNRPLERPASSQYFQQPGLTWSRRSQLGLSVRAMPERCIFGDKGPYIGDSSNDRRRLMLNLGIANSEPFRALVRLQMTFGSFEVGVLQRTPVPPVDEAAAPVLRSFARRGWSLTRSLDTVTEVSHAFVVPAVLQVQGATLADRVGAWFGWVAEVEAELDWLQSDIDELCFELYGILDEDRAAITEGFGVTDSSQ